MNSDYNSSASGQPFAPIAMLDADVDTHVTAISFYNLLEMTDNDVQIGMSLMIDDEVMGITAMTDGSYTVKRGCFDTVPAAHAEDSLIWILDSYVGTDLVPYLGTEQIGVKLLPRTSSLVMDVAYSPPMGISMNQRVIRPYNVGQFKVNSNFWDINARLTAAAPNLVLTWVERNRVVQADQLVGYADANVAAEAGTTYHFDLYTEAGTFVKGYTVTSGFTYTRLQAVRDFNLVSFSDSGDYQLHALFYTLRDGHSSWQPFVVPMRIDTTGLAVGLSTEDGQQIITEDSIPIVME